MKIHHQYLVIAILLFSEVACYSNHRLRRGPVTIRGQKRQNPCQSSLRASDMFAWVQQLLSVHDKKLRSGILLAFFGLC